MLADKYSQEVDAILAKYPPEHKRSAVMPLLYLAQREYGFLTREAISEVADMLGLEATEVGSLIGFYTLYHDRPGGTYRIQICTDLPCALRGAEAFAAELRRRLELDTEQTTSDGMITLEEVKCVAACDKPPIFQVQEPEGIHYHEDQTVESALAIVEELRAQ